MYVISSGACDLPNSATPVTPAQIAQQDAYVAKVGRRFTNGNRDFAQIISALTPPQPGGSCEDFTTSLSLDNISPFPFPVPPGVSYAGGGVALGTPSAPAGSPAGLPAGSVWTVPGGGSTYPWGPVQREVSSLIPAWACASPAAASGAGAAAPSNKFRWAALAVVLGIVFATGGKDRSSRRR